MNNEQGCGWLWIPACAIAICALLLLAVTLPAPRPVPPTLHQRVVHFCHVYGRSIDCPAWTQGALREKYDLAKQCDEAYPSPQDVQFDLCLEEYGL